MPEAEQGREDFTVWAWLWRTGGKGIGEGTRAFHFFQNFEICQATGLFSSFSSSLEQGLEFGRVQSLCLAPTIPLGTL